MVVRPDPSQDSLWVAKHPKRLKADSEDWSDCADAQADLSPLQKQACSFTLKILP